MTNFDIEIDTGNFIKMFNAKNNIKPLNCKGRIVISGMGGSGIGGYIASVLFNLEGKKHVIPWNNYSLPSWITDIDCVICVSYSGNTAETLSAAKKSVEIGCKLEVITTGGKLLEMAKENNSGITIIEKGHQPRAALPLLLIPLLYKLGRKNLNNEIDEIKNIQIKENVKQIARKIKGKIPCIYSNGIMNPVSYRWRCQIEENAKQLAFNHEIPEMNHNEIVGWTNPSESMQVILLRDNKEESYIEKRFDTTKKLAWKLNNMEIIEIFAQGEFPLTRMMSLTILGDFVSIELAKLNEIDPTPVKIIENLKEELGGK